MENHQKELSSLSLTELKELRVALTTEVNQGKDQLYYKNNHLKNVQFLLYKNLLSILNPDNDGVLDQRIFLKDKYSNSTQVKFDPFGLILKFDKSNPFIRYEDLPAYIDFLIKINNIIN